MNRRRREREQDRHEDTVTQRREAHPAIAALTRLQQSAGNASVARMLARTELEELSDQPDLQPHAEGQDTDTPQALADAEEEGGGTLHVDESELKAPLDTPRMEAQVPQADPNQAIATWVAKPLKSNADHAAWILEAGAHSFVTFGHNSEKQLQTYAAGGKHEMNRPNEVGGSIDASQPDLLPVLEIVHSMVTARVNRWLAAPTQRRPSFQIGWLARNLAGSIQDAHKTGAALDAGGLVDWYKPAGAAQVIQILIDLPKGATYTIGLPFSGPFFDLDDSLLHFTNLAEKEAAEGETPAPVTTPWLVMWERPLSTAKWNLAAKKTDDWDKRWIKTRDSGTDARSKIKDATLRAKLGGFDGKKFVVLPDKPEHIHIQRM